MKQWRISVLSFLMTILAVLALLLISCGDDSDSGTNQAQNNTQKSTKTISYYSCSFYQDGRLVGSKDKLESGTQINKPDFELTDDEQYRYEFIGWDADGDKEPETFPYELKADTKFELLYTKTPVEYHYEIYVKGEKVASVTGAHYGDVITYPEVKSEIIGTEPYLFDGWSYDGVYDGYTYNQVSKSCRIDAHYADTQIFKYFFGGRIYVNILEQGSALTFDQEVKPSVNTKAIHWYCDEKYTNEFTGSVMPEGNFTLWGREEYIDSADAGIPVASRDELLSAVNAMIINRITEQKFNLQFTVADSAAFSNGIVQDALKIYNYATETAYLDNQYYCLNDEWTLKITYTDEIATKKSSSVAYTQLKSTNVSDYPNTRGASFNAFAVESRTQTYPATTSDALFYALEHGYKPQIDADNTALNALYEKMKGVLRKIIATDMTDFEKAKAIYEYLIMNVVYDANVLNLSTSGTGESVAAYNAFYLEGVFNDGLAVCDGLSKAYAALCAMEGIECVRVTGLTVNDVNHAWNKVKLGTKWYVVDVTSGGCITDGKEVLTYAYFLLSDDTYASHATADGKFFPDVICTEDYDVYQVLGLEANNLTEAVALFNDFMNKAPAGTSTFDIRLAYSFTSATDAVQAIIDEARCTKNISFVSERDSITFIYKNS